VVDAAGGDGAEPGAGGDVGPVDEPPGHGGFAVDLRSGKGETYFGLKGAGIIQISGDLKSTRYSPLDQINASNFTKLEVAWRFRTDRTMPRLM